MIEESDKDGSGSMDFLVRIKVGDILDQRWILKKLFCLTALPKSVMVTTYSAPNFDLEDFFSL